jgi:hypothetical protein
MGLLVALTIFLLAAVEWSRLNPMLSMSPNQFDWREA